MKVEILSPAVVSSLLSVSNRQRVETSRTRVVVPLDVDPPDLDPAQVLRTFRGVPARERRAVDVRQTGVRAGRVVPVLGIAHDVVVQVPEDEPADAPAGIVGSVLGTCWARAAPAPRDRAMAHAGRQDLPS
jgi:hypothetical protein